ncbi:MAG: hypothetical protein PHO91_02825 [Patescibacteria group bacterium]|nr:hypothetical protein [Patescibacteria group bacterium]
MIFFEENKRKMIFIFLAVFLTVGFIVYQYLKINPFGRIESSPLTLLPQINQTVSQERAGLETILPDFNLDFSVLEEEFKKEQEKEELVAAARIYLEEKRAATTTVTSTEVQTID